MGLLATAVRRWLLVVVWIPAPFTVGPALATALATVDRPVQVVASVGCWLAWLVALVAMLVPCTVSLTTLRVVVPASVPAAGWSALAVAGPGWRGGLALSTTTLATVVALSAATGDLHVNGSSYGEERRMPLRPPGVLLLGPVQLTWAAVVAGVVTGPLLLAARVWLAGAVALAAGAGVALVGVRALHVLARRWVVFVPAGLVLVDPLTLTDALLAQRRVIAGLAPARADTTAQDLTAGALGLALELRFTEPVTIVPRPARHSPGGSGVTVVEVDAVLFSPTRPGAVLREASRRRLTEGAQRRP